jgi:hypothetical protein
MASDWRSKQFPEHKLCPGVGQEGDGVAQAASKTTTADSREADFIGGYLL